MTPSSLRKLTPTPAVAAEVPYTVPKHPAPIDLKLDQNEGEAPPEELLKRIAEVGPDVLRRYPDSTSLQRLIAKRLGVPSEEVVVTAGADDSLDRICRAMINPGRRILMTNPTFEMMRRYAKIMGGELDEIPWWKGPFPTEEFIAAARPETSVVAVVTPNNPTGTVATREDLQAISDACPQALLLLDHAYVEFADEDLTEFARTLPNTVIVRTLSKAWGLAGLRVGYTIGPEEIINWLRISGSPFMVSRPSLALAAARLEADGGHCDTFVSAVRRDRAELHALLDRLGVDHIDSQGNFVFMTTPRAIWLRDALAGLGISVRIYPRHPQMKNSLRISCPGDARDNARLAHGVEAAMAPKVAYVSETLSAALDDVSRSELKMMLADRGVNLEPFPGSGKTPSWLLCADDSDIVTARMEQCVPVVLRLGGGETDEIQKFLEAGAARVLTGLKPFTEILP